MSEFVGWDDVVKWDPDCTIGMRLHNFYVFKDAIKQITDYVYGHDYILEQTVEKDIYKVLRSIDEMVKSDDPKRVFETYKPLYSKLSNMKKQTTARDTQFWS